MSFADLVDQVDRAGQKLLGGEAVTYTPVSAGSVVVTGIFDELYVLAKGTAEAGVETLGPSVFLRLEDLPVNPEDDEPTSTIREVNYTGRERLPDGMGGIVLGLRKVT